MEIRLGFLLYSEEWATSSFLSLLAGLRADVCGLGYALGRVKLWNF